ncbi:MAG: hypothetical protein NUW24_13885 [Anaerolineae bacterium]|jgi:hypothetical protein|nr:hypothetical protein [Anaerolineae bacterium]MDH7473324.1 hypothetical protein [Anaerolineae bacterium]
MKRLLRCTALVAGLLLLGVGLRQSIAIRRVDADEVNIYLARIAPYTSTQAIIESAQHSAPYLERVLATIEGLEPPPELAEAHALLVEGYRFILDGRRVLDTHPRGEERAEGAFMMDWGISRLWEHQRLVMEYLIEQQLKEAGSSS